MVCDAARLTCAVLEVAEALRGGPTPFEVVAQVVVPLLLGVGTLIVAFLSFRVARQSTALAERSTQVATDSHRLSEQIRHDAMAERLRRERDNYAAEVSAWLDEELLVLTIGSLSARERAIALERRLTARSFAMDSPNAVEVLQVFRRLLQAAESIDPEWNKEDWVRVRAEWTLRSWQHNPREIVDADAPGS